MRLSLGSGDDPLDPMRAVLSMDSISQEASLRQRVIAGSLYGSTGHANSTPQNLFLEISEKTLVIWTKVRYTVAS